MSTVGAALSDVAKPLTIEWRGKKAEIGYLKWKTIIVPMEDWLTEQACKKNLAYLMSLFNVGLLTKEEVMAKQEDFSKQLLLNNACGFGSEAMMSLLKIADAGKPEDLAKPSNPNVTGILKLFTLITGRCEEDVMEMYSDVPDELFEKIGLALKRSFPDAPGEAAPGAK
jgi:hypothetical protein